MQNWIINLVADLGYSGIALLMFLENIFPPIPSELIMPLAGFHVSRGVLEFIPTVIAGTVGSVIGQLPLYWLGRHFGAERLERWADRHGKWVGLSANDIQKSVGWFTRHGSTTVFFCRFIPGIRSLISIPAGVARMRMLPFLAYSTLGMALWTLLLTWIGFKLGKNYTSLENYIGPVGTTVVVVVLFLWIYRIFRSRKRVGETGNPPDEQKL